MTAPESENERLFSAAAELTDPAQRAAFLDAACRGDETLRASIEDLLRHDLAAASFLEAPAVDPDAAADVTAAIGRECGGTVIGPYKLLQPIGEGGMGTVYMAQQTVPVRRTVALKFIKAGMDSRQVLARFGAERQALALMDHPNIAKVFDAGTTDTGRPYFVMELVKGISITRFCDERRLTTRERLELAIPVCQAVQHAHQRGIIHRDLKPSNVLIALYDGKPVAKVIDFGVAKATGPRLTDQTLYTEFGSVVGTLEYMSPEQAELNQLDIDTRSDIYSLGVLLYELLTGSTPLDRKRLKQGALLEMLRVIREEESPRPSMRLSTTEELPSIAACRNIEPKKLSGLLRGELDWIVMKALEKDRNRRYENANGLAADLRRYLDDEPVQACPPSTRYRFGKFARRNRVALLTVCLVSLALIAGVAASTWQAFRATRAEQAARRAESAIQKERDQTLKLKHRAEERVRWMVREVARTDAELAENLLLGKLELERWQDEFIQRIVMTLENYVREFGDDSDSRYETAVACLHLGRVQHSLHRSEAAAAHFRRALPLWEALASEFPANHEFVLHLAGCLMNLGHLAYERNPGDGEPYYKRALRLLDVLTVRTPENPDVRIQHASCLISSGRVLERSGSPAQAEPYYRRVLSILVRLTAEHLRSLQPLILTKLLTDACYNLHSVLIASGRAAELDRIYVETLLQIDDSQPKSSDYRAVVQYHRGWSLVTRPDVESRDSRTAFEICRAAVERLPQIGSTWRALGVVQYRKGDWKGAIENLTKSMQLRKGGNSKEWFFLAMAHWQLIDKPQARSWYDKAVPWMEKNEPDNEELIRFRAEAADLLGLKQMER